MTSIATISPKDPSQTNEDPATVTAQDDDKHVDPLLPYISTSSPLAQEIRSSLRTDGYCVLESVLNDEECQRAMDLLWDFVEDTSSGVVQRDDPTTWYPSSDEQALDPWPSTGYKSFTDMFQSNGAGWLLGFVRELLAERIFQPLYGTRELHSSKEGFSFHRPPQQSANNNTPPRMVCGKVQTKSQGEHYDQANHLQGLSTIQSLVAFQDQIQQDHDGCFLCYPKSHGSVHQAITRDIYRGKFPWVPLTDTEIDRLEHEFKLTPKRIYLKKGDVIVWRSDLVHAPLSPSRTNQPTAQRRLRAVSYCSMQPASLTTSPSVWNDKMLAYKQRQTGDHRPHVEDWHTHRQHNPIHRPYFRTTPPILTLRLAQLYGLIPYTDSQQDLEQAIRRAVIRGVRLARDTETVHLPKPRLCEAQLEFLQADPNAAGMVGQDKYMGGMASCCGRYIYGVPGTALQVLRIRVEDGVMDWIGPQLEGKFKWLRGVEVPASTMEMPDTYPHGCCIALPCNARTVLKINPATNHVYTFGDDVLSKSGGTGWYYHGGNLAANGWIYAIPANADRVAKIHPKTDQVVLIGPVLKGHQKWFGGLIGSDQCVYGVPHNETGILKIDPTTDEVTVLYPKVPFPLGQWKWHGGLVAGHKIIGFPNNSDQVLILDCPSQRVYTVGDSSILQSGRHRIPQDGRYKYLGGALTLDGRYAYLFPCDAERVLRIDCETDELKLVGPLLLDGENKYQNGFVARDGCLYGIPQRATGILRIVPPRGPDQDEHIDIMYCGDEMVKVKDKFEGGVLGFDECIYCIPLRSKTCVKIVPGQSIV